MIQKYILILFLFLIPIQSYQQQEEMKLAMIPQVKKADFIEGSFKIDSSTLIFVKEEMYPQAKILQIALNKALGLELKIQVDYSNDIFTVYDKNKKSAIVLSYPKEAIFHEEGYSVLIHQNVVEIFGASILCLNHGINTLSQLAYQFGKDSKEFPCVLIYDDPQFSHRGMLLDCARHFFPKETVKKYLDLMSFYKMNVLHWHLTEDQGWRVQIDKYPKLTEVGAWRIEKDGSKYGGFYTKEDIREIVRYAEERGITVIPEIELPGHSQAAVASYPWLSCTGTQVDVVNDWGVFKEIYCAGNDSVYSFLEDVLTEVMDLFPSKYIHIGGDEAPKYRWENCVKCQSRMKSEILKDEHALQSYFIGRIETFLQANGRELIGWDEILEGGISKTATVQSWRGFEGGLTAARAGNKVIMSPTDHCYFDYDLKAIDLKKVWEFIPRPAELEYEKWENIIGGECNLWSEHIPDEATLDSKVFPRMLAMAEVLWINTREGTYDEFYERVQKHYLILDKMGVKYGMETIPVKIGSSLKDSEILVELAATSSDYKLKYKIDQEFIDYKGPFILGKSSLLTTQAYKEGLAYGNPESQAFVRHLGLNKEIQYVDLYSKLYTGGGEKGLVNGRLGSLDFRDGNWQGFEGEDLVVTINFKEKTNVSQLEMNFYEYQNSWIFRPSEVTIYISTNGVDFKKVSKASFDIVENIGVKDILHHKVQVKGKEIRAIKIEAKNVKIIPDWHEAAGSKAWLFIDEIIIK